jgi:hypothetical protein
MSPLCTSEQEMEKRMDKYIFTLKSAGLHGIKKVRYAGDLTSVLLTDACSVQDYCNTRMNNDGARLVLSMFTKPQVPEDDDNVLENYLETQTSVIQEDKPLCGDGFNAAFCMGTYCIGFASNAFWSKLQYQINVSSSGETERHVWYCVSLPEHYDNAEFQEWIEQRLPLDLQTSELSPEKKTISLRPDHGKDKLMEHARNLMNSPYVESVLTSLPFSSFTKTYINKKSDFAHGLIDVVLFWEEKGYCMRVKTTGRNIRETIAIAEILSKRYGRGK